MRYTFLVFMILYLPFAFAQQGDMHKRIDTRLVDGKLIPNLQGDLISNPISNEKNQTQIIRWSQGFEGVTFPPAGWTVYDPSSVSTQQWSRYTLTPIFGRASASVRYESGNTVPDNDDWLITHKFLVNEGDVFCFWGKGSVSTFYDSLEIFYTTEDNNPPAGFIKITTFAVSLPSEYKIPLTFLSGKNIRIAFHYKENDQYRAFVDSVYVASSPVNDASVDRINMSKDIPAGNIKPCVKVKNFGYSKNPFSVKLTIMPGNYESVRTVGTLGQLDDSLLFFDEWKAVKGDYTVSARVTQIADENSENDTLSKQIRISNVLYDNGPYVNYPNIASDGSDGSVLEPPLNFYGFCNSSIGGYRLADEFTVPKDTSWKIEGFTFYAYQYGSNLINSPFTGLNYRIWKGKPGNPGSIVVDGDNYNNKLLSSSWIEAYRYYQNAFNINRPIYALEARANTVLTPGTYWIDWQVISSDIAWVPPIVIKNQPVTGNAIQYDGVWAPVRDSVSIVSGSYYQGLPFRVKGIISNSEIPVELISLSINKTGDGVLLSWSTATETNNFGFAVERKNEGGDFREIHFVPGAGNSVKTRYYSYQDNSVSAGSYVYRLKQKDYDGSEKYSSEIRINIEKAMAFTLGQNYPNPFNPSTNIKFTLPDAADVTIKLYNPLGEEVGCILKNSLSKGEHTVNFNASNLNSGIYFYSISAQTGKMGTFNSVKKMILVK